MIVIVNNVYGDEVMEVFLSSSISQIPDRQYDCNQPILITADLLGHHYNWSDVFVLFAAMKSVSLTSPCPD